MVNKYDLEFLNLCSVYLVLDDLLSTRETVSSPLLFDPNSYILLFHVIEREKTSKKEMREYYKMNTSKLNRQLEPLMKLNLIRGTFGKDEIKVNPKFDRKYLQPIREWMETI